MRTNGHGTDMIDTFKDIDMPVAVAFPAAAPLPDVPLFF
jgi:hypothetical protein